MARHRNVRSMNYDEECEGFDDIYGHSVEDDYCVSPSASQYMYDRSKTNPMSSFFTPEEDIAEDDEEEKEGNEAEMLEKTRKRLDSLTLETALLSLVPEEEILLKSCLDEIHNVVGDTVPESAIIAHILNFKFNVEKALDAVLNGIPAAYPKICLPEEDQSRKKIKKDAPNTSTKGGVKDFLKPQQPTPTMNKEMKVVAASKQATVGFELPNVLRDGSSGGNSKNSSKATSPVPTDEPAIPTPSTPSRNHKTKEFKPELAVKEYEKERGESKDLINLLVIGHVDAGKSTLMGHLLWKLGQVQKKTMHKYETEAKKEGKSSFAFAWILDETGEERSRGITMDVGRSKFETDTKTVILLDAPGHKDFIPNMITGAAQADVAVLVVDSTTGEFETGFESGGQTREHALLVRSLGVSQIVIAVNKLDTVGWSQSRFDEIKARLNGFLIRHAGFRESDIRFVPCSGLIGENLTKNNEDLLKSWYTGPTLLQAIDTFRPPDRPVGRPLRISINDVFKGPGGICVGGRVETGMVATGDKVLVQPLGEIVTVKSITLEEPGTTAFAGDPVLINLQGMSDSGSVSVGFVLSDPSFPCKVAKRFAARVVTFEAMAIPLMKGFTGVMHIGAMAEQVVLKKLISQLNKGTGEVVKSKPRCLPKSTNGIVELSTLKPICLEEFKDVKELGRFTLRSAGITIAAGVITQVFL